MAFHTVGRRMVASGFCEDDGDYGLLLVDEFEQWLRNPASLTDTIKHRRALYDTYNSIQEPFVFAGEQPAPETLAP